MARNTRNRTNNEGSANVSMQERDSTTRSQGNRTSQAQGTKQRHEHRTAKVVELIGTSKRSFEDAVKVAIADAAETTRNITGAQVEGWSVTCVDGKITQYKASIRVVFGIERP